MPIIVTIVIPCRNEENFIGACLDSAASQDYPKDSLEIFVVDGMSLDGTRQIVAGYCQKYPFMKLLDNPKIFTPSAFNVGIRNAKGDYIILMGAHAEYPSNYISRCVARITESGADNIGGSLVTKPSRNTAVAKAIVGALSSPFAAGGSFRLATTAVTEVDTVFGGCYSREVFDKVGYFDERMIRSQDMELNMRLKKAGGKILLFPDIVCGYFPKSNFWDFFVHNMKDGIWTTYPLKIMKSPLKLRHYLPLFFVMSFMILAILSFTRPIFIYLLLAETVLYMAASVYFSVSIAFKEKNPGLVLLTPVAFAARHFGYGIGSFLGIIKLLLPYDRKADDLAGKQVVCGVGRTVDCELKSEERIKKEIEYYDRKAINLAQNREGLDVAEAVDFEGFRPLRLASFRYCYGLLRENCKGKKVLDWGCGNGVHTIPIAAMGVYRVIGIDLSEKMLDFAKAKAGASEYASKIEFLKMNCEKTDFPDNEFDIIFDGGTFSSIDAGRAYPEITRILKPGGMLIGIETYGHNPLANFNRAFNVKQGKRTAWAAAHIFNDESLALTKNYFGKVEIKYFHLFTWMLFPIVGKKWGVKLLDFIEPIDRAIIGLPFLRKYAFKVVFKFSNPKK